MAKKHITNGVDSSTLVQNLNSEYLNELTINDLGSYTKQIVGAEPKFFLIKTKLKQTEPHYLVLKILGYTHGMERNPINTTVKLFLLANEAGFYFPYVIHNGENISPLYVFFYEGNICLGFKNNWYCSIFVNGYCPQRAKSNMAKNVVESITLYDDMPEGITKLTEISYQVTALNKSGKALDLVELDSSILNISKLPPVKNVETIILRYQGVVQDLESYMASAPVTLDSLIEQGYIEDSVTNEDLFNLGILSQEDLEKTPVSIPKDKLPVLSDIINENNNMVYGNEIRPLVNLDEYVGTPNNWLKIYVPSNQLEAYKERYPKLQSYLHKINGDDTLQIGGRNLFSYTYATEVGYGKWYFDKSINGIKITDFNHADICRICGLRFDYIKSNYCVSGLIYANNNCKVSVNICDGPTHTIDVTTDPTKFSYTISLSTRLGNSLHDAGMSFFDINKIEVPEDTSIYIKNLMVERSNTPSDWSPAPEDIETAISSVKESTKQELNNYISLEELKIIFPDKSEEIDELISSKKQDDEQLTE